MLCTEIQVIHSTAFTPIQESPHPCPTPRALSLCKGPPPCVRALFPCVRALSPCVRALPLCTSPLPVVCTVECANDSIVYALCTCASVAECVCVRCPVRAVQCSGVWIIYYSGC